MAGLSLLAESQDKKTLKRINTPVKDIERNGYSGIGKPICKTAYTGTGTELPTF